MVEFAAAGEGLLDRNVIDRVLGEFQAVCHPFYGGNGKVGLLQRLNGYNQAAAYRPWLVLVDLDTDADCAPAARQTWLPNPAAKMVFRIAVKAVEAWILADSERFARFLSIPEARIPSQPELLIDPKETVVALARRSKSRKILEDLVPRPESGRKVGPAYASRLSEFVSDVRHGWRPQIAAANAASLGRTLNRLKAAVASCGDGVTP